MEKIYELNQYLNLIIDKLTLNQDLCKLLYYNSNEPLSESNISDTKVLIKTNIIPKPFIPDIVDTTMSFLIVYFDNIRGNGINLYDGTVTFEIACHSTLWEIKKGIRPYALFTEIKDTFHNQYIKGLGKFIFTKCTIASFADNYRGYRLQFEFTNFSK